jgi:anthranilate phosphoribosyltransferase
MEMGETLRQEEARALMETILSREVPDMAIAALAGAMGARGGTAAEIAGFAEAMRGAAVVLPLTEAERATLVDTCGTGGDASGTFNISTAAALVAAAAGAKVAKHGNRAVTSKCGSADVLEALGIPVDLEPIAAAAALRQHGFCFLAAPSMQPGMKALMPVRRAIGVRTAFNILGPMTNPAGAAAQVMGVYAERLVPIVAETLARLKTRHAFVVHGGGMDEFSLSGPTAVGEVQGSRLRFFETMPADFGLEVAPVEALAGSDAAGNAGILRGIFAGERGPKRDVVVMNAAAVLVTAGLAQDFFSGARLAQDTIDAGKVQELVQRLGSLGRRRHFDG